MITHLEKLWCALYVSSTWYESWERYKDSSPIMKRFAIKCKAVGIVEYDRVLNQYEESVVTGKSMKNIFVYGDRYEN